MPFRNSTFKDIQNPCLCNEKFHFFEYAGTAALNGFAAQRVRFIWFIPVGHSEPHGLR